MYQCYENINRRKRVGGENLTRQIKTKHHCRAAQLCRKLISKSVCWKFRGITAKTVIGQQQRWLTSRFCFSPSLEVSLSCSSPTSSSFFDLSSLNKMRINKLNRKNSISLKRFGHFFALSTICSIWFTYFLDKIEKLSWLIFKNSVPTFHPTLCSTSLWGNM